VNWVYLGTPTPGEALPVLRTILVGGLEVPTATDVEREVNNG